MWKWHKNLNLEININKNLIDNFISCFYEYYYGIFSSLSDAFAGFSLALSLRPQKVWLFWLFNSMTSLVLGVLFVIGWPMSSLFLIGILVGISLLLDDITLLLSGVFVEDLDNKYNGEEQ